MSNSKAIHDFIESWGIMGSVWGINPSTARVHALLIISEEPTSLDEISANLGISRGNASMCLKELRNWGVIKLVKKQSDRRDYYVSESDIWKMFFAIAKERKRREFDPMVHTVETTLRNLTSTQSSRQTQDRLKQMEQFLKTLQSIADRLFANEKMAQSVLPMLTRFSKEAR